MSEKQTFKIYTLKLKKYLESLNFKCLGKEPSLKNENYDVFLFEKTDKLEKAINEYLNKEKKENE